MSLKGGYGTMVGAATALTCLAWLQNILDLASVSNYWIEPMDGGETLFALILAGLAGREAVVSS